MYVLSVWEYADEQEPGEEEDYVWGVAYRIDPSKEDEVRAYLGEFFLMIERS